MTSININAPLPKWPTLLVKGDEVTKEQAEEILFRTSDLPYLSTNDREYKERFYLELSNGKTDSYYDLSEEIKEDFVRRHSIIKSLYYLQNHQICSSYIGGPHGWCDWDGNIFTKSYNIGKWPTAEEVLEEWKIIAKAFPYLSLTSQLTDKESSEEGHTPLVEYRVKEGDVEMVTEGLELLMQPEWGGIGSNFCSIDYEIGYPVDKLLAKIK